MTFLSEIIKSFQAKMSRKNTTILNFSRLFDNMNCVHKLENDFFFAKCLYNLPFKCSEKGTFKHTNDVLIKNIIIKYLAWCLCS